MAKLSHHTHGFAIFTPDGASVVYSHGSDDGTDIYIAALTGGGGRRLSVGRGSDKARIN